MRRPYRLAGVSGLSGFACALAVPLTAAASAVGPPPGTGYAIVPSHRPGYAVGIAVTASGSEVKTLVQCQAHASANRLWTWKRTLPLRGGRFSYRGKGTVTHITAAFETVKYRATVRATGQYTGQEFTGTVFLSGSPCGTSSYTAPLAPS